MTAITDDRRSGSDRTSRAVQIAEKVLSSRAGSPVALADPHDLGGSGRTDVVRVRVAQNPVSMDRSLVLKVLPADEPADAFDRELASYKYATALPSVSRPGPQLIAFDLRDRVIVLSDLGGGRAMTDLLASGERSDADHGVSAWGQALGRMHAATVGGEHDFEALLRQNRRSATVDALRTHAEASTELAGFVFREYLGAPLPPVLASTLAEGSVLFSEGDHRAFSPSDVGPENILINDDGVQFMDYEWGGFRDATLDVAYALVTLPPHLPPERLADRPALESALIEAWRSEVQAIWPALLHDGELARRIVVARVIWVWLSTVWLLPVEDHPHTHDVVLPESQSLAAHGLALYTTDAQIVVQRWRDLAHYAQTARLADISDCARDVASVLEDAWLR